MKWAVCFFIFFSTLYVEAIEVRSNRVVKSPRASSRSSRSGGRSGGSSLFSAGLLLMMGQGKMGNDTNVPNRSMLHSSLSAFIGVNWGNIRIGPVYEYTDVGQMDDPQSFGNQNISGNGSAFGARLDYYDGTNSFGVIYRFQNEYKLKLADVTGAYPTYKAKSGYQVQYFRHIKKKIGFVVDYTMETFDESFAEKVKWDRISLGIVLSTF